MSELIIPKGDIEKLEQARLNLFKLLEDTQYIGDLLNGVTNVMWRITHTKYPTRPDKESTMIKETCSCCDGIGILEDVDGNKGACMTCNGKRYFEFEEKDTKYCNCPEGSICDFFNTKDNGCLYGKI